MIVKDFVRKEVASPWMVLALALLFPGCAASHRSMLDPSEYENTIRIACVGDSITFGYGIKNRNKYSYPAVLQKLLGNQYEVRNFGVSGATVLKNGDLSYWELPAFQSAAEFSPDAVIIKLGTNDTKPQNWQYRDEFEADYSQFVDFFLDLPSRPKVWLCYPVPVYRSEWGIKGDLLEKEIQPTIKLISWKKRTPVINLFKGLSNVPDFFPDGIHPDENGAEQIALLVRDALIGQPVP